ncbi:phosphoribosylanthranilate isomerase [Leuconostoc gelidum subsp. gasicomitatum]|uniref:phosphoribosylanthranilate isomerase n=1 Tax=Leuconostoc gasicomitatum TaxID=115778 RepID=UPI001CC54FF2|nr:phosphoribosylanthranilate isomerase [Leuconostoc gasicomitatum]MBZ5984230.1 phosphoribosylanthranilate isomerase [Leuconostoc gasicomitatum]
MTKIKLCGNFRVEDADLLNKVHPDMAGIIFAPGQRRTVNLMTALKIRDRLDGNIPLYGVFVNQNVMDILTFFSTGLIQGVQLHGDESELEVTLLREKNVPVIQVVKPQQALIKTAANYVLLDNEFGSGKTFDWRIVPPKPLRQTPLMLAGGLTTDNLQDAINQVQPEWVDISSGDEVSGIKNLEKMRALVDIVRQQTDRK